MCVSDTLCHIGLQVMQNFFKGLTRNRWSHKKLIIYGFKIKCLQKIKNSGLWFLLILEAPKISLFFFHTCSESGSVPHYFFSKTRVCWLKFNVKSVILINNLSALKKNKNLTFLTHFWNFGPQVLFFFSNIVKTRGRWRAI